MKKNILISPNSFKHSLNSVEMGEEIKKALNKYHKNINIKLFPIADGGDGTLEVFKYYFKNSKYIFSYVHDPLMRKIQSTWLLLEKNIAVIELAKASGISLLKNKELNPLKTTTYGAGELILQALNLGCKKIILTVGGSSTSDAGIGIMTALGVRFFSKERKILFPSGESLGKINFIDFSNIDKRLKNIEIVVLCDVQSTLFGENGFVKFLPQKGASKKDIKILKKGMGNYKNILCKTKIDRRKYYKKKMTGASGGVPYTLMAMLKAKTFLGFNYLEKKLDLKEKILKADIVITGEGNLDSQSLLEKGPFGIVKLAKKCNKHVIFLCGDYKKNIKWKKYGISKLVKIKPEGYSHAKSIKYTKILIHNVIARIKL